MLVGGEHAMADVVETTSAGALVLRRTGERGHVNLIIPSGHWTACYAASVIDGSAVAVEHWKGEVARGPHLDFEDEEEQEEPDAPYELAEAA
jgi:hypothetical protein